MATIENLMYEVAILIFLKKVRAMCILNLPMTYAVSL